MPLGALLLDCDARLAPVCAVAAGRRAAQLGAAFAPYVGPDATTHLGAAGGGSTDSASDSTTIARGRRAARRTTWHGRRRRQCGINQCVGCTQEFFTKSFYTGRRRGRRRRVRLW